MSEFFFNLIAVSGKIGEGVHIVCSNVLVGWASSPSLTGKMSVPQRVIFFGWVSILSATGKMPVPQRVIFFCGVISCQQLARYLFHKELFFFGSIDITNITFFQKGGKCGMM